jgi:hypothetical protein
MGRAAVALTATLTSQVKDTETRLNQQITAIQASTTALTQSMPGLVANQVAGALHRVRLPSRIPHGEVADG